MLTIEDVNQFMSEAGPMQGDIEAVSRIGDDEWVIAFEAIDVDIEFDVPSQRLFFSAEIGVPPAETAQKIFEVMLTFNGAWRQTGGAVMSLSGPGGAAAMMANLASGECDPGVIATIAANLAERALVWRDLIGAGLETAAPATFGDMPENMMRI